MNLLHIDSSILGPNSVSRTLSKAAVDKLTSADSSITVTYRDLVANPIPHLTGHYLGALSSDAQHDQAMQEDLNLGGTVLEEFLAADVVVIGVALYNFTIPTQLKAWVDRIAIAGKTFRYTEKGPEGLAGNKRVILTIARGGFYGPETPAASFEHAETYMRSLLAFLGIYAPEVIVAEGIAVGPEVRETATNTALAAIGELNAA